MIPKDAVAPLDRRRSLDYVSSFSARDPCKSRTQGCGATVPLLVSAGHTKVSGHKRAKTAKVRLTGCSRAVQQSCQRKMSRQQRVKNQTGGALWSSRSCVRSGTLTTFFSVIHASSANVCSEICVSTTVPCVQSVQLCVLLLQTAARALRAA